MLKEENEKLKGELLKRGVTGAGVQADLGKMGTDAMPFNGMDAE